MARYRLCCAVVGQANASSQYQRYPAGTTIANSSANAVPGDVVWPVLAGGLPLPSQLIALDSAASAALGQAVNLNTGSGQYGAGQY